MGCVYFDNNATTPVDSRVRDAMLPWFGELHGNPSSIHQLGQRAREAVEEARQHVATLIGAQPPEIIFTASGTEANNALLWHVAEASGFEGHFVLSALEHPSVQAMAERLARYGIESSVVAPGADGVVACSTIEAALRDDTQLVCLMSASNEIGTLQPIEKLAPICRQRGIWLHCDAVQSAGKVEIDVGRFGVDSLVLGSHKFHGPLGAAALWVSEEADFSEGLVGGSQERGRRAGTENVAALVGFGEACRLAAIELEDRQRHLRSLRDCFEAGLGQIPDVRVHCATAPRLPHTSHIAVMGAEGEALLIRLDIAGFAVSTGSACASGVVEPSRALLSMGVSAEEALASLRISFGMTNTLDEVRRFLDVLATEAAALRRTTAVLAR